MARPGTFVSYFKKISNVFMDGDEEKFFYLFITFFEGWENENFGWANVGKRWTNECR